MRFGRVEGFSNFNKPRSPWVFKFALIQPLPGKILGTGWLQLNFPCPRKIPRRGGVVIKPLAPLENFSEEGFN